MRRAKFPARKRDGSFCVEAGLKTLGDFTEDLAARAQAWINDVWMPQYPRWRWEGRTGPNLKIERVQVLDYSDEFIALPEIVVGPNSELQLRLRGKETARFWRDWLVFRLKPDLEAAFPEIGKLLYIRDCVE
jgi:hypothetical protein